MSERFLLTGTCWCGCGQETANWAFFLPGHDKAAEASVILAEYDSVPAFLVSQGYAPGDKNPSRVLVARK